MIFAATLDKVLSGEKTQTRRVVKGDETSFLNTSQVSSTYGRIAAIYKLRPYRLKYQVGKTYAVQPGRGKKAVGRIKIIAIRREWLQEITGKDAIAEGIVPCECSWCNGDGCGHCAGTGFWNEALIAEYRDIWQSLNYPPGFRWEDNPEVWVIEFERVEL